MRAELKVKVAEGDPLEGLCKELQDDHLMSWRPVSIDGTGPLSGLWCATLVAWQGCPMNGDSWELLLYRDQEE